jgi:hypothetical protein
VAKRPTIGVLDGRGRGDQPATGQPTGWPRSSCCGSRSIAPQSQHTRLVASTRSPPAKIRSGASVRVPAIQSGTLGTPGNGETRVLRNYRAHTGNGADPKRPLGPPSPVISFFHPVAGLRLDRLRHVGWKMMKVKSDRYGILMISRRIRPSRTSVSLAAITSRCQFVARQLLAAENVHDRAPTPAAKLRHRRC